MENFNNRELAGLFWLFVVFVFTLTKKELRASFIAFLQAAMQIKLLIPFALFGLYMALFILLWNPDSITAIIWFFASGLPLFGGAVKNRNEKEEKEFFQESAKDAVKGTILIEYICALKAFSFTVEVILTPIVFWLAAMAEVAKRNPEHRSVENITNGVLAVIVFIFFINSISYLFEKPDALFMLETYEKFFFPIYLTILSTPFLYVLYCYSCIELAIVAMDRSQHSKNIIRYAKKRFFIHFGWRPWLLSRAKRQFFASSNWTILDVDKLLGEILRYDKEEKSPPVADENAGWSPHNARYFLSDKGLCASDFHENFEFGDWCASGTIYLVDGSLYPHSVSYYMTGVKGLVKRLELKGFFYIQPQQGKEEFFQALNKFKLMMVELCHKAIPNEAEYSIEKLNQEKDFNVEKANVKINFVKEKYSKGTIFSLKFTIEKTP